MNPGERLRAARERAGWSLEHVALQLRLSPNQVEALESGRRENLPPAPYVRGYLRSYAQLLGLDPQEFAKAREGEAQGALRRPKTVEPVRQLPSASILYGLFLVAVIVGLVIWHSHKARSLRAVTRAEAAAAASPRTGVLPPRLQSLAASGSGGGQLRTFPLQGVGAPRTSLLAQHQAPRVRKGPASPAVAPPRAPGVQSTAPPVRPTPALIKQPVAAPSRARVKRKAPPMVRAHPPAAPPPVRSVQLPRVITVAPAPLAVPNPGGLISLPQGRRHVTLSIDARSRPVRVSIRDAKGVRLLATRIRAGHSVHVVGQAPFHVVLSHSHGVILRVGGRAVALPASPNGQSVRVKVDP